jgi:hypothetical protein
MPATETSESLETLMADPRLVELCELQRIGDEVLDVIDLSENQHSDVLAWMLDAKEGHGQGDEILRDLLVSASTLAATDASGLDRRGTTAKFFAEWPPSRIRTTGFGATFIARELGMSKSDRVDLFVIDAQNKFVLLVENKAGARHREEQLDRYRESFKAAVAANSRLKEFDQVYIAIDREFDDEETASRPASSSWLHLGYDWLKTSATRALMHVARGNAAARLVVSYCNRQTDWEDPNTAKCVNLAAALHQSYPAAVKHLVGFSQGRLEREWLTNPKEPEPYSLFVLQNKGAIALLKEMQGMASVKAAITARLPSLPADNVEYKRTWLDMCPTGWEPFMGDQWWPVFLNVRYARDSRTKYRLSLCWNGKSARTPSEAEDLRRRLTSVEPKFGKHIDSRWRRVELERGVELSTLLDRLVAIDKRLGQELMS